jgi:hypothetical protein
MVDSENILILVVLIYGVVSAVLIEKYRNKITELKKDKEK